MSQKLRIRAGHRSPRKPLRPWLEPAMVAAGTARPSLRLPEPASARARWISASVVSLGHLLALAGLVTTALLAPPQFVERLIPVELVRELQPIELPGSNDEPAAAGPRRVTALRPSAAALATSAAALSPEQAEALHRQALETARQALEAARTPAPSPLSELEPQRLVQRSLTAQAVEAVPNRVERIEGAPLAALETPLVDAAPLGHSVHIEPRALAPPPRATAPEWQADTRQGDIDSAGPASAPRAAPLRPDVAPSAALAGLAAARVHSAAGASARDAANRIGGGGGSGGSGQAQGVAPCLESAPVRRYLDRIRARTNARWHIPEGVAPDRQVVLRFDLDAAGMATDVEVSKAEDAALGESAVRALRAASPFAATDQATRCLSEKRIKLTFTVPALSRVRGRP